MLDRRELGGSSPSKARVRAIVALGVLLAIVAVQAAAYGYFSLRLRSTNWHVREETADLLSYVPLIGGDQLLLDTLARENSATYGDVNLGCCNPEGVGTTANVDAACIASLGRRRSRCAEPVVLARAVDANEEPLIRWCAIRALGEIGSDASVDPLIALFDEPNLDSWGFRPFPSELIAETLRRITGQSFGPDAAKWRAWRSSRR